MPKPESIYTAPDPTNFLGPKTRLIFYFLNGDKPRDMYGCAIPSNGAILRLGDPTSKAYVVMAVDIVSQDGPVTILLNDASDTQIAENNRQFDKAGQASKP